MTRGLRLWLLLLAVTSIAGVGVYLRCPGCIPRDRAIKTCEWRGDTRFPVDSRNPAHQEHLIEDAQLAEELAIRYADAEHGRRFGVEHHGGLLDGGRVRNECLSRMFQTIEENHSVTSEQVRVARGQRNRTFDLAVVLLFFPLYSLGAAIVSRSIYRRFPSHERFVGWFATGLASIAVTVLGVQCFRLFAAVWEVVRVGNGHMTSIRSASYSRWSREFVGSDFIGGLLLFWLIAVICYRVVSNDVRSADAREPRGILLP